MAKEVDTKGYVKMYRKAQEDEVFKNPYAWQLYTYCLFNATFDRSYPSKNPYGNKTSNTCYHIFKNNKICSFIDLL